MSNITINDFARKAYKYYVSAGMTPAGACGMIGNQYSESAGFYANRVEFLCIKRLKENGKIYTDETYTAAVNSGKISKSEFLNPLPNKVYGFGTSQWTSPSRKSELYDRTVAKGLSIADEDAQLEFTIYELKNKYKSVWQTLTTTNSVKTASDKVLKDYEIPSNWQSLSATRADYSQQFYNAFAKTSTQTATNTSKTVTQSEAINAMIAVATEEIGYLEKNNSSNLDSKTAGAGSGNYTKYWRDVYPSFQGQAWCAAFVSWVFMKAFGKDTATKLLKHWPYTYCPTMANLFALNANPKVGDIVIFYRNGVFAHTGIVISVNGDQFTTIEGNTSGGSTIIANGGGVCKKSYYNSNLPGTKFCTPDWSIVTSINNTATNTSQSTIATTSSVLRKGATGSDVSTMQKMLIALGYSCGASGADGDFGSNTYNALKRFQSDNGLEVDGIYGSKSKSKLLSLYNAKLLADSSVTNADSNKSFVPYMVRVKIDDLNIRTGAGVDKPLLGQFTGKGAFTIVEEATGKIDSAGNTGKWGLLKSYQKQRNGWICLAYSRYTEKV